MSITPGTTPSVPGPEGLSTGEDLTTIGTNPLPPEASISRTHSGRPVMAVLVALVILGVLVFGGWLVVTGRSEDVKVLCLLLGALAPLVGALTGLCAVLR